MMTNLKTAIAFAVGFILSASFAFGQSEIISDQGSPGTRGAWPVRFVGPVFPTDGGASTATTSVAVYPYPCATTSPNKQAYQDGGVQNTPTTQAANRLYTVICNSKDNTSGNLRCRADGTNPVNAVGGPGDVMGTGDCVAYTNPSGFPVKCIGTGLYVSTFECVR